MSDVFHGAEALQRAASLRLVHTDSSGWIREYLDERTGQVWVRHSFASNLTIGGTPLRQVQEWLGHSTITMTMRYAHLAPGGGREYLAALDSPVTGKKVEAV